VETPEQQPEQEPEQKLQFLPGSVIGYSYFPAPTKDHIRDESMHDWPEPHALGVPHIRGPIMNPSIIMHPGIMRRWLPPQLSYRTFVSILRIMALFEKFELRAKHRHRYGAHLRRLAATVKRLTKNGGLEWPAITESIVKRS
jgi:hypothetical protein